MKIYDKKYDYHNKNWELLFYVLSQKTIVLGIPIDIVCIHTYLVVGRYILVFQII